MTIWPSGPMRIPPRTKQAAQSDMRIVVFSDKIGRQFRMSHQDLVKLMPEAEFMADPVEIVVGKVIT